MSNRTEWPTSTKLEDLRALGKVSFSVIAARLVGCIFLLLALMGSWSSVRSLLKYWKHSVENTGSSELLKRIPEGTSLVLIPMIAYLVGYLLCGFLQTRFLFRVEELKFDLAHLNPFSRIAEKSWLTSFIGMLLWLIFSILVAVSGTYLLLWNGLGILNLSYLQAPSWYLSRVQLALPVILMVLGVAALCAWFASRFLFMYKHRMSREEIEAEAHD